MASYDRNEQHSKSVSQSSTGAQRHQTHISEETQAQIDDIILQSRREAENYKNKYEKSQAELQEARRELKNVKEENEALRFQCVLRDDEFQTEEKERRRAQAELQRVKAQLQQLQLQPDERQWLHGLPRPYEHRWTLPAGCGHLITAGYDVCDSATSNSDQDHTQRSSASVNAGGLRQSPSTAAAPPSMQDC